MRTEILKEPTTYEDFIISMPPSPPTLCLSPPSHSCILWLMVNRLSAISLYGGG